MVINAKGQIVIPKALRDRFGLTPGQEIEFKEDHGKVILVKKGLNEKFKTMAAKYRYQWPKDIKNTKQLLKEMRG